MLFNKSRSIHKIKAESERSAKLIFPDFVALPASQADVPDHVGPISPTIDSDSSPAERSCVAVKKRQKKGSTDNPNTLVHSFLRIWLSLPLPFCLVGVLLEKAEITSGSARDNLSKSLIRLGMIVVYQLQWNRSRVQVWEPTDKAYHHIGIERPSFPSKGGYLHQFCAHHIAEWGKSHGFRAQIEFFLDTNKAVDVVLSKDGEFIFVEIVVSPPLDKELENILKDTSSELKPTQIWLIAKDSKTARLLSKLVSDDQRLAQLRDIISCKLAGDFLVAARSESERRQ